MEAGGRLGPANSQRFLYVLEGSVRLSGGEGKTLMARGYAYLPPGDDTQVIADANSRVLTIEKPYAELERETAPGAFCGCEESAEAQPLMGDKDVQVRSLLPSDSSFDFAVNTMTFQPGASLSMVEMHVMEHGLLMLDGGGIYRLGDCWYPVSAGDFIWMAPYCPQWFGALGKKPARYLIYKDWNRHP
jgi:(S)-ureidoglycine aminohydrolase